MDGPDLVFDRALIGHRRRRASRNTVPIADFLLLAAAKELVERLATVKRKFAIAADIGSPLPHVVQHLCANGQVKRVVRIDRDPVERDRSNPIVIGDEEYLPFRAGSLDLATSILALQFVNDLPGALVQIRRALKPDGLFLGALLGGDTLTELRQSFATAEAELTGGASPRVAPFAGLRAVGALLQRAGFELPVVDQDRITVRYDTMFDVLRDLRAMGATNALVERSRRPLRRSVLMRAAAVYAEQSADPDGRIRATFDLIWLSGWSPHESQQKPLQPGSAKVRLADVLGTTERSAGDKTGR
ncbi:MAG: methyltransferase domain-containing protein [Hyphomicrobiales bacterium]|nr:methyltransferase domain-containing protein [Hyphomicrobiales bacterium]